MPTITERRNDDGSRSFVAQVRIKGFKASNKTFHQSDYPTQKDASKAAADWADRQEKTLKELRERGTGAVRTDVASLKVKDVVKEYLDDPETKKLLTYDERARQLAWWSENYDVRTLSFINGPRLLEARKKLIELGHAAGTVNRYLAALRKCMNWGRLFGLVPPEAVFPKGLLLTEPKAVERFLSDDELSRVLEAARDFSPTMYAAIVYAIGVGVRASEQLRLCWGDVGSTTAIKVTKSDTSRRAHTPPAVLQALKELQDPKVSPLPSVRVFLDEEGEPMQDYQLIDRWQKIRATAGVPDVRWHDLRHSCASILIQNGASLAEVAAQLGHKNIATSKRYAHLVPGHKPTGADALNAKLVRR